MNKRVWGSILRHCLACRRQHVTENDLLSVGSNLADSKATDAVQLLTTLPHQFDHSVSGLSWEAFPTRIADFERKERDKVKRK